MKILNKILFLIDYKYSLIFILISLFLFISFLETFSIAIIVPFITVLSDFNNAKIPLIGSLNFFSDFDQKSFILFFGILIIITLIIKSLLTIICWYLIYNFSWGVVVKLKTKLIDLYKNYNYELYIKKSSSQYIQYIAELTNNFNKLVLVSIFKLTSDLFITVCIAAFLAYTDLKLFLTLLIVFSLVTLLMFSTVKERIVSYSKEIQFNSIKVLTEINNLFKGYKEIKIYDKGEFFKSKIIDGSNQHAKYRIRYNVINLVPRLVIEITIAIIAILGIFYLFVYNSSNFDIFLSKLVVFVIAAIRLGGPVSSINVHLNNIKMGLYSMNIVYDELKSYGVDKNNYKFTETIESFNSIKFNNVSYKYPGQNIDAIDNLNFTISKNQIIGIYGDSGAGKTTLLDVLLGFLIPYKGSIIYNDNIEISKNNINSLQNKIAYIPQDIFITNDSFTRNITLEEKVKNNQNLKTAIDTANLKEFIGSLKNGLNTTVGDNGINISGGQRQRISIARAFYHNREIIIFDEATNSLDEKTERKIIDEIFKLKESKTIIIISHNYKILDICSKIIILKNGKIEIEDDYNTIFKKK